MCELQRIFDNMLMIKLICAIFVIDEINCLKNVCDKDCIADVLINKNNLSAAKDSDTDHNITVLSSVFDKLITYDEWNQVINENLTCDPEKLPHYVVPEISSHERGTKKTRKKICKFNRRSLPKITLTNCGKIKSLNIFFW